MEIFIEINNYSINDKDNLLIFGLLLIGLVVIFSYGVGNVSAASGNTIYVNGSGGHDTNDGSSWLLAKQSIKNATGTVSTNGTVKIANGVYAGDNNTNIQINNNMTIIGQSQQKTIINGNHTGLIFFIEQNTNVLIDNLTITNGTASSSNSAGISNYGTLNVVNTTLSNNNQPGNGAGAVYNAGNLLVQGSQFINNTANNYGIGGAIFNDHPAGTFSVLNSTFINNQATWGGAIYNFVTLNVTNSIFLNNYASYYGGAIDNGGTMNVTQSTFLNNSCNFYGGAICNEDSANSYINFCRIFRKHSD